MKKELETGTIPTWCPGCFNFQILLGLKQFISKKMDEGMRKDDFAIGVGIGCHAKIFDYINLNGVNSLHGRTLPACVGMKIGNPNLNVIGFSGDGDAYAEGMEHLIHTAKNNVNMTYVVHNNQVFALTVGQPTPVSEIGFSDKSTPKGTKIPPINPIKLMLAAGATFVARVFADAPSVAEILEKAHNHKGFAFVEVLQPCIIFHPDKGYKEKLVQMKHDTSSFDEAMKMANVWDYNGVKEDTQIPVGVFYEEERITYEESFEQLQNLMKEKKSWKDKN